MEHLPGVPHELIEEHEESALGSLIALEVLSLLSLWGLIRFRGPGELPHWFVTTCLFLSIVLAGMVAWISQIWVDGYATPRLARDSSLLSLLNNCRRVREEDGTVVNAKRCLPRRDVFRFHAFCWGCSIQIVEKAPPASKFLLRHWLNEPCGNRCGKPATVLGVVPLALSVDFAVPGMPNPI